MRTSQEAVDLVRTRGEFPPGFPDELIDKTFAATGGHIELQKAAMRAAFSATRPGRLGLASLDRLEHRLQRSPRFTRFLRV